MAVLYWQQRSPREVRKVRRPPVADLLVVALKIGSKRNHNHNRGMYYSGSWHSDHLLRFTW